MASGLSRVIGRVCRTMTMANIGGILVVLLIFLLGGFIVPNEILNWLIWGYWVSPLTYGFNAIAVNEILSPRWMNKLCLYNTSRLGISVLNNFDVFPEKKWYWIGLLERNKPHCLKKKCMRWRQAKKKQRNQDSEDPNPKRFSSSIIVCC